jgi:hypothetical protein
MGDIAPSKQPKEKKAVRKGDNNFTEYAKGGWVQKAMGSPGALHKQLGVPAGEKIPIKLLNKAAKDDGLLGKRARLAITLRGFRK